MTSYPEDRSLGARDPWPLLRWVRRVLALEILVYLALALISCFVPLLQSGSVRLNLEQLDAFAMLIAYVQVLNVALFIVGGALAAILTYRTTKNAHALAKRPPTISPAWAVGWYFVPVANLAMPLRVIRQIWAATFGDSDASRSKSVLITWWWAAALASIALGIIATGATLMEWPSAWLISGVASPLGYALSALGAFIFIRVFSLISRAQHLLILRAPVEVF